MRTIYWGDNQIKTANGKVNGGFVSIDNEQFYKISNYNGMPDFFMTIVSDSDHWMYLSSNGSLSAGRNNRDNALFPYYTVDKIHDYKGTTGSKTLCLVTKNEKTFLWEPFTDESERIYIIRQNLYKSIYGNKVIFEEENLDLGLVFQYGWYNSEQFGWVKKSTIKNISNEALNVELLDGIQNILPYGDDHAFQNEYSNLLDAYKKNELIESSALGLFILSSIPVDKAEPSEALKATTVWSKSDFETCNYLVSNKQIEAFRNGVKPTTELDIRATRGAYYLNAEKQLGAGEESVWYFVAEVNQDSSAVANLEAILGAEYSIINEIESDIKLGTENLIKRVASADGLQLGNDQLCYARHFSNTLFNIMRGGIYSNNYLIDRNDFILFVQQSNYSVFKQFECELNKLPETLNYQLLLTKITTNGDVDLVRLANEYLPLTFSRRHGDPSRPWNQFSIELKNTDGSEKLNFQGNWRDIFQNWEALNYAYPEYIEGILGKFLNASTVDGYNPYRITREGLDWEAPDPEDPWAYIGYWGDHQIIYLQKFLEQSKDFHPGKLDEWLTKDLFVFANVPYRIKSYSEIVKNPQDTIQFNHKLNSEIEGLANKMGADGRLLLDENGDVYHTNLLEKILITLLAKLSNFIPEAGIWLNTQRPEWNDANNALVGNGVSMVTLYYIRRFLKFWETYLQDVALKSVNISEEVAEHFEETFNVFIKHEAILKKGFSDEERFAVTQELGEAGSIYREKVYDHLFSGERKTVGVENLKDFMTIALKYVDQTIVKNRWKDGLYHAYNLAVFGEKEIKIRRLYEMLEGQVAVLSSGLLSAEESLEVLDALKSSDMFREDQYSYMLYPNRELPRFNEKNNIPEAFAAQSLLIQKMNGKNDNSIVSRDEKGNCHFNGNFRNAAMLETALNQVNDEELSRLVDEERESILGVYEHIFDHQSFTGRSGTFYGYEGLGSIYWHMVSKLLLATQENYFLGLNEGLDETLLGRLKTHYYEIKAGIGLYKSPELYGAFPTDAYSHTPSGAGAKQPGLTGQVKEDVISRYGELGVRIQQGQIMFNTHLLNPEELLKNAAQFNYYDASGNQQGILIHEGQLILTLGQVPVVCSAGSDEKVTVEFANGSTKEWSGNALPKEISEKIFNRSAEVKKVDYQFEK